MDYESADSREKGCWNPAPILAGFHETWKSDAETPEFVVADVWCDMIGGLGFGSKASPEIVEFWKKVVRDVYQGDEGRKKLRMAAICLVSRDGLLWRLSDVKCPVYWLQVMSLCAISAIVADR
jgi:microsomal epoxide hydrolase